MILLRHILLLTILFFTTSMSLTAQLVMTSPEEVGMSTERLQRLTDRFNQYVTDGELPGSAILVARKGQIPYFEVFGQSDMEEDQPMTKETIFRIASQTKAIVSVGIMILQEHGKLLISDPLSKYIPEFEKTTVAVAKEEGDYDIVDAERPIFIKDLLTLETVQKMAGLPQDAHPGEQFVYGYSTDILGALIEVVSGEPLDVFLSQHILQPLGMSDTHFYLPQEKRDRLAVVYSTSKDGLIKAPEQGGMIGQGAYIDGPRKSLSGGAGFLSTAHDYAKFLQMMLNGGIYENERILSRKSVELMTVNNLGDTKYPWTNGAGFGLGYSVVEDLGDRGELGSVGEYGWGGAYHSVYWVDPAEELVVVYFTQVIPADNLNDHNMLRSLIYQAIID